MTWLRRLANLARPDRLARDIDREMAFHIAKRAEELRRGGMPESDALLEARRRFGNRTLQAERTRDADVVTWLDSILGDLRYALRAMRRSPGFALVAVGSLALGIGANTAIYTLIDAVMVRPLPVPHVEELVQINGGPSDKSGGLFSNPLWEQVRARQSGMTVIAAFNPTSFDLAERGESRRVPGAFVSGDYFRLFGMRPALGRLLGPGDDVRGCPPVAVLSNGFWGSEYGGRDVIGRSITLDGTRFEIVGITSGAFTTPEVGRDARLFVPLCTAAVIREKRILDARSDWWLYVMGRRDPDVSVEQLAARLAAIAPAAYGATIPPGAPAATKANYAARTFGAVPAETGLSSLRARYSNALLTLMGAVAIVLLIACANVANLLLARAAARQHEVAIRMAIGAGRRRLVRQLFTESTLLAVLGALAGLAVAYWATRALVALISTESTPVALDLSVNRRVLGFTVLVASVTAALFGLVPAWRATRMGPHAAMKAGGRGVAEGHARFTLGKALVAAQVALSLMLVVGAGLLVSSLKKLSTIDPGFRSEGVLVADVNLHRASIPPTEIVRARREVLERVREMPGVRAASTASHTPVSGDSWNDVLIVEGFTPPGSDPDGPMSWFNEVSDGYFATLETRLLAGRDFGPSDLPGSGNVAIVNDAAARYYFGTSSVLGRQFRTQVGDTASAPYTIVGVVENAKYSSLRERASRIVYVPASQSTRSQPWMTLLVRAEAGDPLALVPAVRSAISGAQPAALLGFRPLSRQIATSLRRERLLGVLSGLFGGVALLLSMLGLYGVMSYAVARRRNEIGVRIALGAARAQVVRMVLGDVARVVAVGLVVGGAGALASGKLVKSFLYGLEPTEPSVMLFAALLLGVVALAAGGVPAWRAARVDPVEALHEE
jgi:putative ABC transport system permease protein